MADQRTDGLAEPREEAPGSGAKLVSFGFVIDARSPRDADELCSRITTSAPGRVSVELLVLDDHLNPQRRQLVDVIDGHGDTVRLVPRPSGGQCERLDAASLSSCSEFLVVPIGTDPPLEGLSEASREMFTDGTDVVTVVSSSSVADPIAGEQTDDRADEECSRLAGHLGLGEPTLPDRVVLIRRWVARWLFSEVDRSVDPLDEVAERARLLGLRTLVMDTSGLPVS